MARLGWRARDPWAGCELCPCQEEPGAGAGAKVANQAACTGTKTSKAWCYPALAKAGKAVRRVAGMWQGARAMPSSEGSAIPVLEERQAARSLQACKLALRFAAIQPLLVFNTLLLQSSGVLPTGPGVPMGLDKEQCRGQPGP